MKIIDKKISSAELSQESYGDTIKAVVDIAKGIMAIGGELHADEEALLLDEGSLQTDLWGINLHPDQKAEERVEFDSMINVRPRQGNRSRGVEDNATREKIIEIVNNLIG